ncbi:DNRLRE domain-containing protein [Kitasatospora sp. NBC_01302]|uniref:DNRLRE domain-containing protein n=1 Tax=Kitasatospora sp. NBC_01302 TaxID=2903575 RepID=UPI002E1530B0|nr:DNRLRE domain-containing protein [Kitasatospora sp. NBC_01302]
MHEQIPVPRRRGRVTGARPLGAVLAFAVTTSLLAGAGDAFAAPTAPGADRAARPTAGTAADLPSARIAARLGKQRVEALSERTESSTTWANPDGSLTTDFAAGPVRFQRDGAWVDVDLDLKTAADGTVAPQAHPGDLKLAGPGGVLAGSLAQSQAGGAEPHTLVTLGSGEQRVELQWQGGLPKPVLDGTRATYPDAIGDGSADLVVEATRTGFEQFVTLKQRPAATGYAYTMPLRAKGLKAEAQPDGSVLFTDAVTGAGRAVLPAPVMWDASTVAGSSEHPHQAKVDLKVVQHGDLIDLRFTPDTAFLADPATQYPVTVDPSTAALGNVFDTRVQQGEKVDWSADTELYWGNSGTKNADGSTRQARSFINWNTAPISDALVSKATLSLYNFHSGNSDCLAYPWDIYDTGLASTASRWTAQPSWNAKKATSTETKGRDACGGDGWINADVTNLVQTWASAKNATSGMGLRAPDESSTKYWKEVNSANAATNVPKLTVTYNYRPRTGTDQQAGSPFYKDQQGTWWVNSTTPTLRDTFIDPNNDKVDGTFQIFDAASDTQVGNVLVSPYVPSGQPASVTVPAGVLANGRTYRFRTSPYDGTNYNNAWSPWATFTVDASAPSAPASITSTDYPSSRWVKGAGQSGVFTVVPPAGDQNALEWSLDGTTWTKVATGGSTAPVNLTVTPAKGGGNTLRVRATDRAENKSEPISYAFQVGAGAVTVPNDGTRTAARVPLAAETDPGAYNAVGYSWRRSDADPWTPLPVADVSNNGSPVSSWPLPLTNGKSPALSWNAAATVSPDGTVQLRADFTGPGGAATSSEAVKVIVDRKAQGAATRDIGPGTLNLLTGDLTVSATDVSMFEMSVGRTHSSRDPNAARNREGQAPIFGPHWVSGISADAAESDYTEVRQTSASSLDVVSSDGEAVSFTAGAAPDSWTPEPGNEQLTLRGAFAAGEFTLSDTNGTVTTFAKVDPSAATWTVSSSLLHGLANTTTTVVSEKVTTGGRTLARPKLVIAPTSAVSAAACAADPGTKGCRVLQFGYAGATTATGTATGDQFGDYAGQLSTIKLWATAPGAGAATATDVATYRYDANGWLRQTWDPRLGQAAQTQYTYSQQAGEEGLLTSVQKNGQIASNLAYGTVTGTAAAGPGMLTKVWHDTLAPGSADKVDGTATSTVVYNVPTSGDKAPEDLSAAAAGAWGQSDLPTDATAVFPADRIPASNNGADLTAADYARATVSYLNASGLLVNEASPGHRITTSEYDRYGHQTRSLGAANRELALGASDAAKAQLADLGLNGLAPGERAQLLSQSTVYSADGQRETDSYGPLHRVTLTADAVVGGTAVAKAGTQVVSRTHVARSYDEGRPTDGSAKVKDQVTTTVSGGWLRSWPELFVETRTDRSVFDWTLGVATEQIKDAGGLALTTKVGHDSQGRSVSTSLPASNGSDAGTVNTTFYTATGTGPCAGRPEWADLVCRSAPAGDITGGGANPAQQTTKTVEYGLFGQLAKSEESANGVTRTTTITSDAAGRPLTTTVSGGVGAAVPTTTNTYHPATGTVTRQESATGGTITKGYDSLGRLISYTDADGGTTTTEYDALDRPTKVTDSSPSTTTFGYDTSVDPRGLLTSATDSVAGTFGARYDADGDLVTQTLPGGYTMTDQQDPNGTPTSRSYTRGSDGAVVVADHITETVQGQWATHTGTPGITASQVFGYDQAGRLTRVQDTSVDAVCTTRSYAFDRNSNRTALATATAPRGQECGTDGATTQTSSYDSADRITNAGYAYDAFGRTTALPGSTLGHYSTDLVQQQVSGGNRQTWALDSAMRFRSWTVEANQGAAWAVTAAKTNHYDGDGDNPRWITEDAAGNLTRNVDGLNGGLAATTSRTGNTVLQLANLHGDITLQLPLDGAVAPTVLDFDEYGQARAGQPNTRYGWIGSKQRSSETLTSLALMGARLYNPASGRFLSTDPVYGGNANPYDYCSGDPLTCYDLTGRWGWRGLLKAAVTVGAVAGALACGASIVCGVAVAATAAAVSYTVGNAGTSNWSWKGLATNTAFGAASGLAFGGAARWAGKEGVHVAFKGVRRFGVSFTKNSSARGSNFHWNTTINGAKKYGNNFRIHSHQIKGMSRWKAVHYHHRGSGGIKNHRPWQGKW